MEKPFEIKILPFELKQAEEGIVEGFASTFGNRDLQDDIVDEGSFAKTLQESGGKVPILDHHNPSQQLGWNLEAAEIPHGLKVKGQLDLNVQRAREKFSLAKKALEIGARMGLSIGFRTIKEEIDRENNIRHLKEIRLLEYSLVTFPANPLAAIFAAKQMGDTNMAIKELVERLTALLKAAEPPEGTRPGGGAAYVVGDPEIQSLKRLIKIIRP